MMTSRVLRIGMKGRNFACLTSGAPFRTMRVCT